MQRLSTKFSGCQQNSFGVAVPLDAVTLKSVRPANIELENKMKYGFMKIAYEDGQEIPSIVMGDGTIGVTDILKNEEGLVGVGFWPAPDNGIVGNAVAEDKRGEPVTELGLQFQIMFDNPDSIDVVISRLQAAKDELIT